MTEQDISNLIRRANIEGLKGNKVVAIGSPTLATDSEYYLAIEPYMPETPNDMLF